MAPIAWQASMRIMSDPLTQSKGPMRLDAFGPRLFAGRACLGVLQKVIVSIGASGRRKYDRLGGPQRIARTATHRF